MSHMVKTSGLQVGMRVVTPIRGAKGDIKVNKGEVLSGAHVEKMKKWKGLDNANPKGIEIESTPLASGDALPRTVDRPWESPLVQSQAKQRSQGKVAVPAIVDDNGNVLNPSPLERELAARDNSSAKPAKS